VQFFFHQLPDPPAPVPGASVSSRVYSPE